MGKKDDARTFLISVAAELAGMHAQTLRTYDRLGLVSPSRSSGGGRRYSQHDVNLLREVQRLLKASIEFGLEHREDALRYAQRYGRDLNDRQADQFVGMYVNDWTLDFGPRGRQAVTDFLAQGHAAGVLPELVVPEFVK